MSDSFSLWQQIEFPISIFKVRICYLAITLTYYHCAHFFIHIAAIHDIENLVTNLKQVS